MVGRCTGRAGDKDFMPIESGPTGERKVRSLLLFLMVLAFGLWFAYDGWVGYPAQNVAEHLDQLPKEHREAAKSARIYNAVIEANLAAAKQIFNQYSKSPEKLRAELERLFGGPPSVETKEAFFYFGPTYRVTVPVDSRRNAEGLVGRAAQKSATDIQWQKGLAVGLILYSVYLLFFVLRVRKTWLVLSSEGLSYRGVGPIGWDAMSALDISNFARKGYVDLLYDDQGTQRKMRLDEYHLEKFDDVIDELCAKKGFENPLPVEEPAPQSSSDQIAS